MKSILLSFAIFSSLFSGRTSLDVKVFKKVSTYSSDIICTVRGEKIYKGSGSYSSDVLYTVRDGKVFSGTSNYNSDVLFSYDGNLTLIEFVATWHSVMLF